MKEDSIEETKKQLELILKVRKGQKEIIECAGGSCINCDPDIKALTESIDILSDYKRVLKENELLRKDIESWKKYCEEIEKERIEMSNKNCKLEFKVEELQKENEKLRDFKKQVTDIESTNFIKYKNYISIQKVKDRIEELNRKIDESINNSKGGLDEEFIEKGGELLAQKRILQELLESEE